MREALKMSVYVGERDRAEDRLLADALMDVFERHGLTTSTMLRGTEGFGIKHRLQTGQLLTLSEDLPIVALAVDEEMRIRTALADVRSITSHGLITLERALLLEASDTVAEQGPDGYKLTLYVGRGEQVDGRPAYTAIVDCLHRSGLDGASVLLGLDGHAHGVRRRARFLHHNAQVPLMIISVGGHQSVTAALSELLALDCEPAITLERVRVCRRDGVALGDPHAARRADGMWQKLVIYASEQTMHQGQPQHSALVRRLREEGAAGATVLRGLWGYHGSHQPHGERFWSLRRHVPAVTVLIDTPANAQRWYEIVAEMTDEVGLVTSELVPALRASGPEIELGALGF
jgi:PII-like signaling protein